MDSMNTGNLVTTFRTARISQWEKLLQAHASFEPVHCMPATLGEPAGRPAEKFSTGSEYEGTWDELGMSGRGRYTFPNEVIYEGELFDGMFHGEGELQYPDGAVLRGRWRRGELLQRTLIFADGLAYKEEDWEYCTMPDRRFTVEYNEGLRPAGATFLTAKQPTPDIPPGCLDTADGFYDPVIKMVMRPDDIKQILRAPGEREQAWIEAHCRRAEERPCGARPDLYEEWEDPGAPPPPSEPPAAGEECAPSAEDCALLEIRCPCTSTPSVLSDEPCIF